MAELSELVPELRDLLAVAEEDALNSAKTALEDIAARVETPNLKDLFTKVNENLTLTDNVLTLEGTSLNSLITDVLDTGDLTGLFEKAGLEVTDEVRDVSSVFKRITSDIPERKLYDLSLENDAQLRALDDSKAAMRDIDENPDNLERNKKIIRSDKNLSKFEEVWNGVKTTVKTIVVLGIVIAVGVSLEEFIRNYIRTMSGAFLVTTTGGTLKQSKINKYSCIYPDNTTIDHPYESEISKFLGDKKPCSEVHRYGNCAGWADLGVNSRLGKLTGVDLKKLGRETTLACKHATVGEAFVALAKKVEKNVIDIVGDVAGNLGNKIFELIKQFAPFIAIGVGGIAGVGGYVILNHLKQSYRVLASVVMFILFAAGFYFLFTKMRFTTTESAFTNFYQPYYFQNTHNFGTGIRHNNIFFPYNSY